MAVLHSYVVTGPSTVDSIPRGIEREARLDAILTALWHGRLTAEAAADRIVAELGLPHHRARAEVEGFLRD